MLVQSLSCLILAGLTSAQSNATNSQTVDLGYARYQGSANASLGLIRYYGIPYAQEPSGDLRWRPPQPIDLPGANLGDAAINATSPGPQCPQLLPAWWSDALVSSSVASPPPPPTSEDCLRLDVLVSQNARSESLPVLVFIHGGGYTLGSSFGQDGSQFASFANGSIVFVQIQYRLGSFGFLSSEEVRGNGSANVGLLDQRAALEWVQRHISAFGGDPDRVTIWGGSAGGGSVTNQLILNGGNSTPPFHAAIAEYPWWQTFHNDSTLESQYDYLLNATNCTDLSCLRGLDSEVLENATTSAAEAAYTAGDYGFGDFYFGPSVDGVTIQDLPSAEFAQGHFTPVPLLTDREAYEGVIFTNLSTSTFEEVQSNVETLWPASQNSPSFLTRLFQLYPSSDFEGTYLDDPIQSNYSALAMPDNISQDSAFYQLQTIFADAFVDCPTYQISSALSNAGMPVWKLIFAAGLEIHSATIPFLLGAADATTQPTFAENLKDYFVSFIVSHDPNASPSIPVKPEWPEYLGNSSSAQGMGGMFQVLEFNQTAIFATDDQDASARCDFLHSQSYVIRN